MLTTADRFGGPGANRWQLRHGNAYADGATATILSTEGGFARLGGHRDRRRQLA